VKQGVALRWRHPRGEAWRMRLTRGSSRTTSARNAG